MSRRIFRLELWGMSKCAIFWTIVWIFFACIFLFIAYKLDMQESELADTKNITFLGLSGLVLLTWGLHLIANTTGFLLDMREKAICLSIGIPLVLTSAYFFFRVYGIVAN